MNNTVIQAVSIGFLVANFLLNTFRVQKGIELCKECLIILNNKVVIKEEVIKVFFSKFYSIMFRAYCLINDYSSAVKYGNKLLVILQENGEKTTESELSLKLATLYYSQSKYVEAKQLCEKALAISTEIGDRHFEASAYGNLGAVLEALGEYVKAKGCTENALRIRMETGDRDGQAENFFAFNF